MLGLGTSIQILNRTGQEYFAPNYSLSLDGANDYVQLSPATGFDVFGSSDKSWSFWAKRTEDKSVSTTKDVVLGLNSTGWKSQIYFNTTGNRLYIESNNESEVAYCNITADTDWHHYVITSEGVSGDEATVVMYEDGSAITTHNIDFGRNSGFITVDRIGRDNLVSTHGFTGFLYQIAMWYTPLDADAVAAIYNSGTPIPLQENSGNYDSVYPLDFLFHLWRFEEGSGTETNDTGNSNFNSPPSMHGILTNGAAFSTEVPTDDL